MNIKYYRKNNYGKEAMYIVDQALAKSVAKLTGQKTLTEDAKEALGELGFTFEEVLAP